MNWNWNQIGAISAIVLVLGGISYIIASAGAKYSGEQIACTMEAKQCPDGSYVGRSGPSCEFTACPEANTGGGGKGILPYDSGVRGTVLLGPTCPVMRDPPDPGCADRGYQTMVSVYRKGSTSVFATMKSSVNGTFLFSLPPGNYTLAARGGQAMPTCSPTDVTVGPSGYTTTTISCDSGIR